MVDKGVLLTKVFSGGPAQKAGLKVGEFILEVNGESVEGWTLEEVSSKVKERRYLRRSSSCLRRQGKNRSRRAR